MLDAIKAAVDLLRKHPEVGKRRGFRSSRAQDVRSWSLRGFRSYLIFYRTDGNDLEIVRFIHGARDLPRLFEDES